MRRCDAIADRSLELVEELCILEFSPGFMSEFKIDAVSPRFPTLSCIAAGQFPRNQGPVKRPDATHGVGKEEVIR
jgi:hypothetical protein